MDMIKIGKGDFILRSTELEIKGSKDGFTVIFSDSIGLTDALSLLDERLSEGKDFFKDANFLTVKGKKLSENDKRLLSYFMEEHYHIHFQRQEEKISQEKKITEEKEIKPITIFEETEKQPGQEQMKAIFVKETLRSGVQVEFDGHVIVLGDVNPGARVTATGNIIILGFLRGIAHAGATGDRNAFVVAERLAPIQLRIANSIAIAPDKNKIVEEALIAKIVEDNIVIESCLLHR